MILRKKWEGKNLYTTGAGNVIVTNVGIYAQAMLPDGDPRIHPLIILHKFKKHYEPKIQKVSTKEIIKATKQKTIKTKKVEPKTTIKKVENKKINSSKTKKSTTKKSTKK